MSLLDLRLDEVEDLKAIEEVDSEFLVTLQDLQMAKSKKGNDQLVAVLKIENEPNAKRVFHYMGLPQPSDSEEIQGMRLRAIKHFCDGLGIPYDELTEESLEDHVGKQGYVFLRYNPETDEYESSNSIRKWITSK